MPCVLLDVPLQRDIGEKVEISPPGSEVEELLGDSLLAGCSKKAVDHLVPWCANGGQKTPVTAAPLIICPVSS